jgi:hypothetical protein
MSHFKPALRDQPVEAELTAAAEVSGAAAYASVPAK